MGAGLLALPYTFKRASLVPGAASMLVTGLLNFTSFVLLGAVAEMTGAKSYRDLCDAAFGSTASTAMRRSGKNRSRRERISSVTELLPAPPVPVMPTTGT